MKVSDPGTVEGNVVFTFLDAFDPDTAAVQELKAHYRRGGLGDMALKRRLEPLLQELIAPLRTRRQEYAAEPGQVMAMLKEGTQRARAVAADTVAEVKRAMGLSYF